MNTRPERRRGVLPKQASTRIRYTSPSTSCLESGRVGVLPLATCVTSQVVSNSEKKYLLQNEAADSANKVD